MNPLDSIEQRIRIVIETAILREAVRMNLSRLETLDAPRAASYSSALASIGEGD